MGPASPAKEQEDPCVITASLEIAQIIKDLCKTQSLVTVAAGDAAEEDNQMSSMILEVDPRARQFVYQAGSENKVAAIVSSPMTCFHATLRGVSVRFSVPSASRTTFDRDLAVRSPIPAQVEYLQRRSHFRPPLYQSYTSTVTLPDGKPSVFDLVDISMGGVALSSTTITAEILQPGIVLDAKLDFAELGKMNVTLKIVSHRVVERKGKFIHIYGCSFHNVAGHHETGHRETRVQQLVFKLERLNKPWWHTR